MNITIAADGTLTFIHSDELVDIMEQGEARIRRASHVEPADGGGWTADMAPSGGPVLVAADGRPFRTRGEALAAEVSWLETERGL